MEKKQNITQYRERLNKTLASPDLTDEETLKTLVKSQLLRSSEDEAKGQSSLDFPFDVLWTAIVYGPYIDGRW